MDARFALPPNLPVPRDDGLADHLVNLKLPAIGLPATDTSVVNLANLSLAVIFAYPRTGVPDNSPGPEWDAIPGARGCTPQACAFRDLHAEFQTLGVAVYGLSTQRTDFQQDFVARNHIPFPVLSDHELRLVRAINLPVFEYPIEAIGGGGPRTLLRRMAWFVEDGVIRKLWYPVFPPDKNASEVLSWVQSQSS
ncbi:MAG: peroxiredoxin [Planctomycetota bacterium]|nr:peroxiredoxin [Planctomycetota bacterium]